MSRVYSFRLRKIRTEHDAALFALDYVAGRWDSQVIQDAILMTVLFNAERRDNLSYGRTALALSNVSITYFVRLTAEFEGILKDHLQTNYPHIAVPAKPKIDELISRVVRAEALSLNTKLRDKLNEVRDYRNALAHRGQPVTPVTFDEALARYTTFISKLSDPIL